MACAWMDAAAGRDEGGAGRHGRICRGERESTRRNTFTSWEEEERRWGALEQGPQRGCGGSMAAAGNVGGGSEGERRERVVRLATDEAKAETEKKN
jgi:hypothetical protein